MDTLSAIKLLCVLLLIESVCARTITHHQTITNSNGDKVVKSWTTHEDDNDSNNEAVYRPSTTLPTFFNMQPQSETLRIGGSTEQLLKQTAAEKGMDPVAVDELLATKQPVVKHDTDEQGRARTITYELEPNGYITRKTQTEVKPIIIQQPSLIRQAPWSTTTTAEKEKKIDTDWEWNPQRSPFDASPFTRSFTSTWQSQPTNWPTFDDDYNKHFRPGPGSLPETTTAKWPTMSGHNFGFNDLPSSWTPRSTPATPFATHFKSPFDDIDTHTPGTVTKTNVDEHGNKVTTTYTVGPTNWTRKTYTYPASIWPVAQLPTTVPNLLPITTSTTTPAPTTTTTARTPTPSNNNNNKAAPALTTTPLPSLEDFLKSQYDNLPKRKIVERDYTNTPKLEPSNTTPLANVDKPVTTIKVEDLPITQILYNGSPADEHFIQSLPKEFHTVLEPTTSVKTIKIENIPMTEFPAERDAQLETSVRSYTAQIHSPHLPTAADLDPKLQDILKRAGIDPADISSADGNSITKTRTEPDGRTITTTYRVQSTPTLTLGSFDDVVNKSEVKPIFEQPTGHSDVRPYTPAKNWFNEPSMPFDNGARPLRPTVEQPNYSRPSHSWPEFNFNYPSQRKPILYSPIVEFLSRIGLSIGDIESSRNEYVKTIVDNDGRTLTATFRLTDSTGKSTEHNTPGAYNPIKYQRENIKFNI